MARLEKKKEEIVSAGLVRHFVKKTTFGCWSPSSWSRASFGMGDGPPSMEEHRAACQKCRSVQRLAPYRLSVAR